jgi:16S rRNA (adenine1518-N6/adenine1519-N6)-dimethyltransferase
MKPTTLAKAKKYLGQNFLHDPGTLGKIWQYLENRNLPGWMEIGCGTGAMTQSLSRGDFPFLGVEVDSDLIPDLEPWFMRQDQRLLHQSVLTLLEGQVLETLPQGYGIFGNLPYNITSPILERIFSHFSHWTVMVCMVQKEVGDRLLAAPGSRKIGRVSLFCNYHAELKRVLRVSRGCFSPAPAVDSVLLSFERKQAVLSSEGEAIFFRLLRLGYSQRRKKCFKLLRSCYPEEFLVVGYREAGVGLDLRAEQISLQQWILLARKLEELSEGKDYGGNHGIP